ncbi:methionyl-tRNA formyltransferase [Halorientalis pallida]|uniref:Methionyl-tRNA formyltransferase n=1 Tax=Halorientalis pallida TaxID=2479928 RepID=A0A498KUC3_9EURY|nr:methionyl-tRNA formyltransferase [Halorientalis pallida]RXK46964.1 methionyl-tRNA formyltransferase [Halorientalis pallida]
MDVVFVSHNDLGHACLEELDALGADIRAVFTRPTDGDIADQTDFSSVAATVGADYHEVESVNTDPVVETIAAYDPELLFVVGWSRLVERRVLDIPSVAALGMHPAPLPRGRGRAPIAWNLIKGLDTTALSLFHLVEEADAGDLVGQRPIDIELDDDAASLYATVVDAGRELIREYYPRFETGEVPRIPQDDARATWWPKRVPEHGLIDWRRSSMAVYNWIRGQSHPYPGAYSYLKGRRVTVWEANPPTGERVFTEPGEIRGRDGDVLRVGTWEGRIELTQLQIGDGTETSAGKLLDREWVTVGDMFTPVCDPATES